MTADPFSPIAALNTEDLHREARQARLVAPARCCHPSTWQRLATRTAAAASGAAGRTLRAVRRPALGPVDTVCRCA